MSGWNFSQVVGTSSFVLVLGATLGSAGAFAATKNGNAAPNTTPRSFNYDTTGAIRSLARPASITGPSQLSFSGVAGGNYVTGSNETIQLGQFVVTPVKAADGTDAVTTYNGTPFVIQLRSPQFDKTSKVPLLANALPNFGRALRLQTQTLNSLLIKGHLDGTIDGSGQSAVTATVDTVKLGGLQAQSKNYVTKYAFPVRYNDLKLPTSWTMKAAGDSLATTTVAPIGAAAAIGADRLVSVLPAAQVLPVPAAEMLTFTTTTPTPTPEPTSAVIFAVALGGFVWSRRRRNSRHQAV